MSAIESLVFRLVEGVDEAAFIAADARVQTDVIYQLAGLARRTLARGEDGRWLVLTIWHSEADATAAQADAAASAEMAAMMQFVEPASIERHVFTALPG